MTVWSPFKLSFLLLSCLALVMDQLPDLIGGDEYASESDGCGAVAGDHVELRARRRPNLQHSGSIATYLICAGGHGIGQVYDRDGDADMELETDEVRRIRKEPLLRFIIVGRDRVIL